MASSTNTTVNPGTGRISNPQPAAPQANAHASNLTLSSPTHASSVTARDTLEVKPQNGGKLRVRLGTSEARLETTRHLRQGDTTVHIGSAAGLLEPTVRGPASLRIVEQRTIPPVVELPASLFALEDGVLNPIVATRGADSTVVVRATQQADAIISGRVPVTGSVIVRLMPTGDGEGDNIVYSAQRYVVLNNNGRTDLKNVRVDLMSPHSSLQNAHAGAEEALMAMINAGTDGDDPAAKGSYGTYTTLEDPVSLAAGKTLTRPLGEPIKVHLRAAIDAEITAIRPRIGDDGATAREIKTFATMSFDKAREAMPPARYEILDPRGNVLTTAAHGAIKAKDSAKLGTIPFKTIKGAWSVRVDVTDRSESRADVDIEARLANEEHVARKLDVVFDLWDVAQAKIKGIKIDGEKPEANLKVNPKLGHISVPIELPAATDAGPGTATVQLTLNGIVFNPRQGMPMKPKSSNLPPAGMYS